MFFLLSSSSALAVVIGVVNVNPEGIMLRRLLVGDFFGFFELLLYLISFPLSRRIRRLYWRMSCTLPIASTADPEPVPVAKVLSKGELTKRNSHGAPSNQNSLNATTSNGFMNFPSQQTSSGSIPIQAPNVAQSSVSFQDGTPTADQPFGGAQPQLLRYSTARHVRRTESDQARRARELANRSFSGNDFDSAGDKSGVSRPSQLANS